MMRGGGGGGGGGGAQTLVTDVLRLPTPDYCAVSPAHLDAACAWLEARASPTGRVYVQCNGGHGRAPTVAACFLLWTGVRARSGVGGALRSSTRTPSRYAPCSARACGCSGCACAGVAPSAAAAIAAVRARRTVKMNAAQVRPVVACSRRAPCAETRAAAGIVAPPQVAAVFEFERRRARELLVRRQQSVRAAAGGGLVI